MEQRQHYSPFFVADQVSEMLHEGTIGNYREEVLEMCRWLECHRFDRRMVNHRLHLYATDGEWRVEG